jgi:hypothetical protein
MTPVLLAVWKRAQLPVITTIWSRHPLTKAKATPSRYAAARHVRVSPRSSDKGPIEGALALLGLERHVAAEVVGYWPRWHWLDTLRSRRHRPGASHRDAEHRIAQLRTPYGCSRDPHLDALASEDGWRSPRIAGCAGSFATCVQEMRRTASYGLARLQGRLCSWANTHFHRAIFLSVKQCERLVDVIQGERMAEVIVRADDAGL